jgi:hypothetical protein
VQAAKSLVHGSSRWYRLYRTRVANVMQPEHNMHGAKDRDCGTAERGQGELCVRHTEHYTANSQVSRCIVASF